jgi:hypothetical protein
MADPFSPASIGGGGGGAAPWVKGTAYTIGIQVVSPIDLSIYVRKTNGGGATDPSADTGNWQPIPGSIKSIQRGVISLAATQSATATITSVTTGKSELRFLGGGGVDSGSSTVGVGIKIVLTNATTITATTGSASTTNGSVSWELTERY